MGRSNQQGVIRRLVSPIELAREDAGLHADLETLLVRELLKRTVGASLAVLPVFAFMYGVVGGSAAPARARLAFAATLAAMLVRFVFLASWRAGRLPPDRRTFVALASLAAAAGIGYAAIILLAVPSMDPFHIAALVGCFVSIGALGVVSMAPSPTVYVLHIGWGLAALLYRSFGGYLPGYSVLGPTILVALGVSLSVMVWFVHASLHGQFLLSLKLESRNRDLAAALASLKAAQERLVANEKLSALGRLIAQLSHEINNPVNVIANNLDPVAGYLTSLEEVLDIARRPRPDAPGELLERWRALDIDFIRTDMRDALASMEMATTRIRAIQDDLRAFLRRDTDSRPEADLNVGVRSTVALMTRHLGSNVVVIEHYGELPLARFHAGQLSQVTLNLLQNAIDAVGAAGRIEIETQVEPDWLVLSVTDSGPGLSETARRHLFEPFYTTKGVGRGTGLGLATCYQIVRAHGGTISLDEAHRCGARFVVKLPLVTPPPP
ncbi:MAG TPA: ATP-binding protein [Candidatus Acidoferrum sp.]|nr:ATP-binding protein [Candidatus Acidoferrum sp.]